MNPTPSPRMSRRIERLLPVVILTLAAVVAGGSLSSCGEDRPRVGWDRTRLEGVPIVRVRLAGPVDEVTVATTGSYALRVDGRTVTESQGHLAATRVGRSGGIWRVSNLHVRGTSLSLAPGPDGLARFGGRAYRGRLRLVAESDRTFLVVNHVDLESYLAGVLPKELYAAWELETYRALAIAARTFALYHMKTSGRTRPYDVGAGQAHQVYGGATAETERSWAAVGSTHGRILVFGPPGEEKIFLAQYSACNGGYVNGAYVIRPAQRIQPLLGGQEDRDGRSCPRFTWGPVSLRKADLHRALAARYEAARRLDGVARIEVVEQTPYGRAVWLDVYGPAGGSLRVRAEDLRLAVLRAGVPGAKALYSMNCKMRDLGDTIEFYDGRGFGHGVGLSQWSAQDKAERGWNAGRILAFYYPGAKVVAAY